MGIAPFSSGEELLDQVMKNQELRARLVKDESPLHYQLESKLDERRKQFKVLSTRFAIPGSKDFSSNDVLSLSSSVCSAKHGTQRWPSIPASRLEAVDHDSSTDPIPTRKNSSSE